MSSLFSKYYDTLNADANYSEYADFLISAMNKYTKIPISSVLDIGCGSGSILYLFAQKGYDTIGVDIDEDMLNIFREKISQSGSNFAYQPLLLRQDMRNLDLYGDVNAAFSTFDCFNHLLKISDVEASFAKIHNFLTPGGVFVFDINTPYRFENIYANNVYVYDTDDVFLSWENYYNERSKICDFYLTFFEKGKNGKYQRSDEIIREKCYSPEKIAKLLEKTGFEICEAVSDFDFSAPKKDSEKLYFIARKK